MLFRKLTESDADNFCALVVNMYQNLENAEWFSPMPYDKENILSIITSPRFFLLGGEENGELCAISSFDFKCGKLIGQTFMPSDSTLENTVEIAFTMVHSNYRGRGIMKQLLARLVSQAALLGKKYIFGKVHVDNLASYKSFISCGFTEFSRYDKYVKREEFQEIAKSGLYSKATLAKAEESLNKNSGDIAVKYAILLKEL